MTSDNKGKAMHQPEIREVLVEDFDSIFLLLKQLWPRKKLHKDSLMKVFSQAIDSPNDEYFCAEINGRIIGFCCLTIQLSLWQEGYIGYINELVVDKSVRGQGIGTNLIKTAIDIAKGKGCTRIELDSSSYREEAHDFYEGMGFEKRAYLFSKEL
jgi:GNAT superfamily N-acetyltransferase